MVVYGRISLKKELFQSLRLDMQQLTFNNLG